jgi:uncharacterized membrane protein YphA (DoxX/SURF4 family)
MKKMTLDRIKFEFPRILIGVIFLLSGLNGLLDIFPMQRISPEGVDVGDNLKAHGILWTVIHFGEIIGGFLLILGSMRQLAVLLLAPVTLGVWVFHSSLSPAGLRHSYVLLVLEIFLLAFYWKNIAQMLGWRKSLSPRSR